MLNRPEALRQLDDQALVSRLERLTELDRRTSAAIIAHLIVLDERKTYVEMGYASLWKYLTEKLGNSAATAQRRKTVVEVARRIPQVLDRLEDGRLELCAAAMLAPVLGEANAAEVLDSAVGMSTRDLEEMVAELRFRPQVATSPRPTLTPTPTLGEPTPSVPTSLAPPKKKRTVTKALGGDEHRMHVSMSKEAVVLRDRAKELLAGKDDAEILVRAYRALLDQIDPIRRHARRVARKAASNKVVATAVNKSARRPSRAVSDQATVEAGCRCSYISPEGKRCTERAFLQDEHHQPFALGGASTLDNIGKLCAAHNALRARQVFGAAKINAAIRLVSLERFFLRSGCTLSRRTPGTFQSRRESARAAGRCDP